MDRVIYTAMTGAKYTLEQQGAVANNLANVDTAGFKEAMHRLRAVPVQTQALPSRAFTVDATVATNFEAGPLEYTGRPLDAAIEGQGWFAVQTPDGGEAYTRAGNFQLSANGILQLPSGQPVLGEDNQPVALPPDREFTIGKDGTISAVDPTNTQVTEVVGRLKLVNPPVENLQRGEDGLFRLQGGGAAPMDETVQVSSGYLEKSNVSLVDQMVRMIALARQFEMNTKAITTAQENDARASSILSPAR
ncbi:flagellar basal-body rod protein FlgF [Tepidiphilus thermophilus]|uniref:Flagellar basal-body rod protein FlgF n=1 Tax=Tepidiphilus thermophilus TaxID=876478 RepID=A0A0K6IXB9_9PROT|nr:flagellar basal-body rod protein FlgF [Tepidiphilus thermophilus]CUB07766.1 flagellar basal-body rod protein FlgF [Tepidiphilus thermophilus]